MCVNSRDEIILRGGECENLDKFENFHKMVNCRCITSCKPGNSLDLG